jgi:glutamate synthase domain-containing protein 1
MLKKEQPPHRPSAQGLYDPSDEHDACGVGFVADLHGEKSYRILRKALTCVCNLQHRGAVDADAKSGDGAGVLTQIPVQLYREELEAMGYKLFDDKDLGVGMFFLPSDDRYARAHCRQIAKQVLQKRGLMPLEWRKVPVNPRVLGDKAAATAPVIEQLFLVRPDAEKISDDRYENLLYLSRREIEEQIREAGIQDCYICSLSSRVVVYKGMFTAPQLERFFLDLHNDKYRTALAVFHQRYSTNTFPTWALAQPFRTLAHNGEINTIRGNRNWLRAREADFASERWGEDIGILHNTIQPDGSDSGSLDNGLELLCQSGRGILHTLMMMVPAAFRSEEEKTSAKVRGFYEYHELNAEPWDGPAALAVSDGRWVAACLDRNGLRPARYKITSDGMLLMSSEVGVGELPDDIVIEKGRLAPGEMIAVDTAEGGLLRNEEIKAYVAAQSPYDQWVEDNLTVLRPDGQQSLAARSLEEKDYLGQSGCFGLSEEEWQTILLPMVQTGQEALGSMGDDTPLAVLSEKPRLLYHYFRQIFAQVTNPAIDPIREKLVMNVNVYLGRKLNWLEESPEHARQLRINSPVLTNEQLQEIRQLDSPHLRSDTISCCFKISDGTLGLEKTLQSICRQAHEKIDDGVSLLVLSDKGVDRDTAAVPMLLAVGALHHDLIRSGKRMRCSILCETGECRDVHQYACLIGYGASAVNPYLVWDSIGHLKDNPKHKINELPETELIENYILAVDKGLLKIMSKMGISKLSSYHGAQIFEAIGLGSKFISRFFDGTPSYIEGVGLEEITRETLDRHRQAWEEAESGKPSPAGFYRFRRDGERHAVTPPVLQSLHKFAGIKGEDQAGQREDYDKYVNAVESNRPISLRDLMRFKPSKPIPIDEVEPEEDILRRFTTAGMSFGALSPEAHQDLAIAMNRIGGKSNSGEGGEDKARFTPDENGDSRNSKIKQVASGRFGVTAEYLASAFEIEIKISQGAKPGEGGQIPGHKVSALIARLRHSTPGVMLISPPPTTTFIRSRTWPS